MLVKILVRNYRYLLNCRNISQSTNRFNAQALNCTNKVFFSSSSSKSPEENASVIGSRMIAPSNLDKWILVWMKKYPKGQVPDRVKEDVMYQVKSRARIKAANYMIGVAIVMCIIASYFGKQAVRSGDSWQKRNIEWHQKMKEEAETKTKES